MSTVGGKAKAGQELRLLNIEADAGKELGLFDCIHGADSAQQFANDLGAASKQNRGVAGAAFIRYLIENRSYVRGYVPNVQQQFIKAVGLVSDDDGQVLRAANHFAVIAAAGELATAAGITGWNEGEAIRGAKVCSNSWRTARSPAGTREAAQSIKQVRAFIQENESRFECKTQTPRDRAGYRKEDGTEFWIFPSVFTNEVCDGLQANTVKKALIDAGFLETDSTGKRSITRRPEAGGKSQRLYVISERILSGDDQE